MIISYYDFKNLPDRQAQYNIVLTHGHKISERTTSKLKYVLYEISTFSVELIYDTIYDKIIDMNVFENKSTYFKES